MARNGRMKFKIFAPNQTMIGLVGFRGQRKYLDCLATGSCPLQARPHFNPIKLRTKDMKVCIAEKPSVAQEIARVIGATRRCEGYFEGNGYQVTWTFGHLCCLKSPDEYDDNWKCWSLSTLPMIPDCFGIRLIDGASIRKQFNTIKKLFSLADQYINTYIM